MFKDFIIALLACICFSIVFDVPKKYLFLSGFGGALAWISYLICLNITDSTILSCFIGAVSVGLFGEIAAIYKKAPVPLFIIPGIITLVPGANMYYSMFYIIKGDFQSASIQGSQTLLLAGAIASGLIVITSIFKVVKRGTQNHKIKKKIMDNKKVKCD
jgi:uncharacterized membrane protein YjjB (DUF3815 family)